MESHDPSPRRFLGIILLDWVAVVSGVIGFVLFIGGALWNVPASNAISLLAGLIGLLIAGYLVWLKEVKGRRADAAKLTVEIEAERLLRQQAEAAHAKERAELLARLAAQADRARAEYARLLDESQAIAQAAAEFGLDREPGRKVDMREWLVKARAFFRTEAIDLLGDFVSDTGGDPEEPLWRLEGFNASVYFDRLRGTFERLLGPRFGGPPAGG